jgi:hypothetical protein
MSLTRRLGLMTAAGAILSMAVAVQPASSQEIAAEHLAAARAALSAIRATAQFDDILPNQALALRRELIQKNPDLEELVSTTINEQAFALAGRRADLEREAALAYARNFSQEELRSIADFYASPAGQKLLQAGPAASQEVMRAAEIWQNGIARDLAQQVANELAAQTQGQATAPEAAQPAAANQ